MKLFLQFQDDQFHVVQQIVFEEFLFSDFQHLDIGISNELKQQKKKLVENLPSDLQMFDHLSHYLKNLLIRDSNW